MSGRHLQVDVSAVEAVEFPVRGQLGLEAALTQNIAPGETCREILELVNDLPVVEPRVPDVDPAGTVEGVTG